MPPPLAKFDKALTGSGEEGGVVADKEALKEAKKLKGKVARKLLFAHKRRIEDEEEATRVQSTVSASLEEAYKSASILHELRMQTQSHGEMLHEMATRI